MIQLHLICELKATRNEFLTVDNEVFAKYYRKFRPETFI